MTFWHDNKFKKLQKQWDEKLVQSGFVDAEKTLGGTRTLIQNSSNAYRQASLLIRQSKADYFSLLSKNVEHSCPENEIDRIVMLKRSEGITICEIVKELKALGHKRCRQTITLIIRKYENKWKIKKWTKRQMNPSTAWRRLSIKS